MRNFENNRTPDPKPNPFGFQGFKNTGQRAKLMSRDRGKSFPSSGASSNGRSRRGSVPGVKLPAKTGDGRIAGRADQKGSLASFMNKELGVKATGKTGLRKTVFETEEQKRLHRNPFKQKSLSGYKKDQAQQVQAAKNLGSIFMAGAKDKCTVRQIYLMRSVIPCYLIWLHANGRVRFCSQVS